jgi:cell division protease FtsH
MSDVNKTPDQPGNNNNQGNRPKLPLPKKPFKPRFTIYWIWGIILVVLLLMGGLGSVNWTEQEVTFPYFVDSLLTPHYVGRIVVVNNEEAEVYLKQEALNMPKFKAFSEKGLGSSSSGPQYKIKIFSGDRFNQQLDEAQKNFPQDQRIETEKANRLEWPDILTWLAPVAFIILMWIFFMRRVGGGGGNQIFSIGKSKATLFDKDTNVSITFNDVAGLEEAKVEIKEIVDFLKSPQKYVALGAKIPKGALLVGPPGTGKTLLAKAVAGEAKVPFFSLSGSDFVEMFVGVGASRVRDLFRQAKEKAPCIIFIDEIDAIGRARGRNVAQGANDERENTLNQLLTEMDGFTNTSGIIILAATNRADILDRALLRPGRFDRQIYVDMPDLIERKEIFRVHLKPLKTDVSIDIDFLARQTPGFSGADIANVCNEAALIAARTDKKAIDKQDFLDAVDRVVGGLEKKNRLITPTEKKVIAYHESGHAMVSWLLEHAHPLVKVTIVPRGKSLGAAWYLPDERQITTTDQMLDEICAALGGRAAEDVMFGKISTGALSDLEKVTKQATAMVSIFGLNDKIGHRSFYDSTGNSEYSFHKPYSEKTAQIIDEEVNIIISNAYIKTKEIIKTHQAQLTQLAEQLLEKEVIFKEDLERILGKRPFEKEEAVPVSKQSIKKVPSNTPLSNTNTTATNSTPTTNTPPPVDSSYGNFKESPKVPPVAENGNGQAKQDTPPPVSPAEPKTDKPVEDKTQAKQKEKDPDNHPTLF